MGALLVLVRKITPKQWFMISTMVVNGGNYLYNLILGRLLGPKAFAEAALMITLLLVLSFIGMTFQMTVAKFIAQTDGTDRKAVTDQLYRYGLWAGALFGFTVYVGAPSLQQFFHTQNALMFRIFGIGIPIYFLMSINRGKNQGAHEFKKLAVSYQSEMWGRLFITVAALILLPFQHGVLVAFGIFISLVMGSFPMKLKPSRIFRPSRLSPLLKKRIKHFIAITAFYELTQILINNSDIILVKRYFADEQAGLYASLALIGRVVYFIAWMLVMLLLPEVVKAKKEGIPTTPMLLRYVSYISALSIGIVSFCALFPEFVIRALFGGAYLSMSALLWQYALATSLFAVANIFTYYYLSLDRYTPIWLAAIFGCVQVLLLIFFHGTLSMVVQVQLIAMSALLITQLIYYIRYDVRKKTSG
ncbi:MATE family efflux transporter [Sediminicola luteus]|uniref:Sugar isomerase n=1 Tax=Sediminicola luteus TaxID=319238 RepID=A0A2A4G3H9_9FLAO|nr:sugar isomerase [Sediminicola luteus]PCE62520.1 sugar isomerase [Sediminicola luteus]